MPGLGMTGRWPGFAAPLAVMLVTLAVTWLSGLADGAGAAPVSALLMLILLPAPLILAVLWGGALLTGRPFQAALAAAAIWLVVGWVFFPRPAVLTLAGHVVAGLVAGIALGRRWRSDLALGAVALALVPIIVWSAVEMPPREQFDALSREMLTAAARGLPETANEEQRTTALDQERENLERIVGQLLKVYPWLMAVGVLGQAGIILAGLWLALRLLGMRMAGWGLPPFTRWRVPFYVVWALIAGLGLMLIRRSPFGEIGLNLAMLGATALSVQGIAIQFFVTGRMLSLPGRVIYWVVMGVFFSPLVLASGVVLGVADQWWDIRRLGTATAIGEDAAAEAGARPEQDKDDDGDDMDEGAGPDDRHRD